MKKAEMRMGTGKIKKNNKKRLIDMPIFEYRAVDTEKGGCDYCRNIFEKLHKSGEKVLENCPKCNGSVQKLISRVGITYGLDFKARGTGLHKLVKRDTGTYEKMY
jgi:putative FmdB family regulatory protein